MIASPVEHGVFLFDSQHVAALAEEQIMIGFDGLVVPAVYCKRIAQSRKTGSAYPDSEGELEKFRKQLIFVTSAYLYLRHTN
jgi:hypothetical protein